EGQAKRVVSDIGKRAGVVVSGSGKTASAHDLRRSFGQRMADAGVPVRLLQAMMRHRSFTTTEQYYLRDKVQQQADQLALYLGTVGQSAEAVN
ncbi:MAG: site-specific integrase, partial [Planctomycetales bacterium]|nr:site-specific integrase [Planctomycetales bacterium]